MRLTRRDVLVMSAVAPAFASRLAQAQANADSLVIAYPFDVPSWDPIAYTAPLGMPIFASIFDQPLMYTADLNLPPSAVKAWRWIARNGLAIGRGFRHAGTFHNGDKR